MKVITFYFSGTGNTRWTAKQFNRLLIERGNISEIIAIESIADISEIATIIDECDYVGFAHPIYGANIPKIMRVFIIHLIDELVARKIHMPKVFFINTFGYVNGFGVYRAKKIFRDTDTAMAGYINIKIFNNVATSKSSKNITQTRIDGKKRYSLEKLNKFIMNMEKGDRYINGIGPHLLVGGIIRRLLKKGIENNYDSFVVNNDICTSCMICVKNCPTKSIEHKNNEFIFKSTCTCCMRCYNICPSKAIRLERDGKEKDIARYEGIDS